ncbi:hypothetical protein ACFFTK_08345 [Pseudonocardia petroleophila]|nr:hypothetical protein [Pseudonocardia petroleophila]
MITRRVSPDRVTVAAVPRAGLRRRVPPTCADPPAQMNMTTT